MLIFPCFIRASLFVLIAMKFDKFFDGNFCMVCDASSGIGGVDNVGILVGGHMSVLWESFGMVFVLLFFLSGNFFYCGFWVRLGKG